MQEFTTLEGLCSFLDGKNSKVLNADVIDGGEKTKAKFVVVRGSPNNKVNGIGYRRGDGSPGIFLEESDFGNGMRIRTKG